MFGYIGNTIINLNKVKAMGLLKREGNIFIQVRYDDNTLVNYKSNNPEEELYKISLSKGE